jgi:hypothetical protein
MSEPASRLPARPSLEQLRKQAKELLRAALAGDESAVTRIRAIHPRSSDGSLNLADAQYTLAREYGFDSWAKLVRHIESLHPPALAKYERLADEVARAYTSGDAMAIRSINWTHGTSFVWDHDPERMRTRLSGWYASATRTPELALVDARLLVAKQAGADSWDELTRSVAHAPARTAKSAPFCSVDERAK